MSIRAEGRIALVALAAGLALAVGMVALLWRIPGGTGSVGASVTFSALPTGEMEVTPAGPFLEGTQLEPSDRAGGSFLMRNQTGQPLDVQVRGVSSEGSLGDVLRVEVLAGDRSVFEGTLSGFAGWTEPFPLASGQEAILEVRVTLPEDATGYEGQVDVVTVELQALPGGS